MFRRILRRLKGWILALALIPIATGIAVAESPIHLTGTQAILLEKGPDGIGGMASVVVDLALGPTWNVTYVHDLAWEPRRRWRAHDVGVTHYLGGRKDLSATVGVRFKIPADEDQRRETFAYTLLAWRFGN